MDPQTSLLLLAMLDHPHQADEIAAAYERGDLDDLLGGEQSEQAPESQEALSGEADPA